MTWTAIASETGMSMVVSDDGRLIQCWPSECSDAAVTRAGDVAINLADQLNIYDDCPLLADFMERRRCGQ